MKMLAIVFFIISVFVGVALLAGFIWMLCLGALSHIFDAPQLAISYWQSVCVAIIFSLLFGGITSSGKS